MSKYSLVKLMENDGEEDGNFSLQKAKYNLVLTPSGTTTLDQLISSLEEIDNYGIYTSNIRNTATNKATINKAIEDHFGPNIPAKKKALEKQRGVPFPPKTKQALDAFVKQFTSKPQLLQYIKGTSTLTFPQDKNPAKDLTKKIIDTVMANAGITQYKISEKES